MEKIQFWLNDKQYNEAITKLGETSELYGFAKETFLKALEEVKEVRKEVWYECQECHKEFYQIVKAMIEKGTGRLLPTCDCGRGLVRRVKKVVD